MTALYRGLDQAALDAGYNNSLAVSDSPHLLADFDRRSAELRARYPEHLDLRYGLAPRNRIDYFAAGKPGPILIFIHGGYWQMRAKETFSFLAQGPLAHGIHVAMMGYTLAPDATLHDIVEEVQSALAWIRRYAGSFGGDTERLVVSGWSAGGHLTAMSMDQRGVIGGLAISGIYDLEPIRLSFLNQKMKMSEGDVATLSPCHRPMSPLPLVLTYGTAELPELQRQSEDYAVARTGLPGRLLPLQGKNHFTILEELANPEGTLTDQVRWLAGG